MAAWGLRAGCLQERSWNSGDVPYYTCWAEDQPGAQGNHGDADGAVGGGDPGRDVGGCIEVVEPETCAGVDYAEETAGVATYYEGCVRGRFVEDCWSGLLGEPGFEALVVVSCVEGGFGGG